MIHVQINGFENLLLSWIISVVLFTTRSTNSCRYLNEGIENENEIAGNKNQFLSTLSSLNSKRHEPNHHCASIYLRNRHVQI